MLEPPSLHCLREIVLDFTEVPDDEAALDLDSLTMVQIGEALEERFGFIMEAAELSEANFGSVAAMHRYVQAKA